MKLDGKVALVTGASQGIGAGIAKALGAAGAAVIVNYATSAAAAQRVVDAIGQAEGKALAVQADVSIAADVSRLFAAGKAAFGPIDIVVNNAGRFSAAPIEAFTEASYRRQFDTDVLGALLVIREALNYFGASGGSIINIGSIVGAEPPAMSAVYAASKAAVHAITRSMARELGARGIRVNGIDPGHTQTEGVMATGSFSGDAVKVLVAGTPLGRLGLPEDIAPAVVFLASEEARWITGETIRVAGGAIGVGY